LSLLVFLPRRSMNLLPMLFLLLPRFGVYLPPEEFLLAQKLPSVFDTRWV